MEVRFIQTKVFRALSNQQTRGNFSTKVLTIVMFEVKLITALPG